MEMAVNVDSLIDALIDREGGYCDHPADKGGPTCFGVTEAVARSHGYAGPMRSLPRVEAEAIYRRLYWLRPLLVLLPIACARAPQPRPIPVLAEAHRCPAFPQAPTALLKPPAKTDFLTPTR